MLKNGRKYRTWQNADDQQAVLVDKLTKDVAQIKRDYETLTEERIIYKAVITPNASTLEAVYDESDEYWYFGPYNHEEGESDFTMTGQISVLQYDPDYIRLWTNQDSIDTEYAEAGIYVNLPIFKGTQRPTDEKVVIRVSGAGAVTYGENVDLENLDDANAGKIYLENWDNWTSDCDGAEISPITAGLGGFSYNQASFFVGPVLPYAQQDAECGGGELDDGWVMFYPTMDSSIGASQDYSGTTLTITEPITVTVSVLSRLSYAGPTFNGSGDDEFTVEDMLVINLSTSYNDTNASIILDPDDRNEIDISYQNSTLDAQAKLDSDGIELSVSASESGLETNLYLSPTLISISGPVSMYPQMIRKESVTDESGEVLVTTGVPDLAARGIDPSSYGLIATLNGSMPPLVIVASTVLDGETLAGFSFKFYDLNGDPYAEESVIFSYMVIVNSD